MSELTALIRDTTAEHPNDTHEKIARLVADATPADRLDAYCGMDHETVEHELFG